MKRYIKKGQWVVLLDHEETPFVLINKLVQVVERPRGGYIGVVAYDDDGDVVEEGSARTDGILRLPVACIRPLRPLEQLAMTASPESFKKRRHEGPGTTSYQHNSDGEIA